MGMRCKVCNHPAKLLIEREIVKGVALLKIAQKYNVSYMSVRFHAQNHLSHQLVAAWNKKHGIEAMGLMEEIDGIVQKAKLIFERNFDKNTATGDGLALKALDSQRLTFELLCKIAQLYHEIRMKELEAATAEVDPKIQQIKDYQNAAKANLSNEELAVLMKLGVLVHGDDDIPRPEMVPSPQPEILPRPIPKTPSKNDFKPVLSDGLSEPGDNPLQDEEQPVIKPLPKRKPMPIEGRKSRILRRGLLDWIGKK